MTSLLKVDLIIHRTADQYHHYSSAYLLFSLLFFTEIIFYSLGGHKIKPDYHWVLLYEPKTKLETRIRLVSNATLLRIHYDGECKQDKFMR